MTLTATLTTSRVAEGVSGIGAIGIVELHQPVVMATIQPAFVAEGLGAVQNWYLMVP